MENIASLSVLLAKFMSDSIQSERTFKPASTDTIDDTAKFNATVKLLEEQGRITVYRSPDAYRIVKKGVLSSTGVGLNTPAMEVSEAKARSVQKTPWRVSLEAMKRRIANIEYIYPASIPHMTIAVVLLDSGYALQGMSAPADPANFNLEKGKEFAVENALQKMWALEAYVMRDHLSGLINITPEEAERRWGS